MPYADIEKQREYQRTWVRARRTRVFTELGNRCALCGSTNNLELDHIDPKTKKHHSIWSWSWSRIYAEVSKCRLLCYTCHKNKSKLEQRKSDVFPGLNWCSNCKAYLPVDSFHKSRATSNGLQDRCKACKKRKRKPLDKVQVLV